MSGGDLLITGGRVLPFGGDDREWDCADVLIRNGLVAAVGTDLAAPPGTPTLDASGHLVVPGLVNAHFHSPGNLLKGTLPGYPLEIFMLREVPPLASATPDPRMAYVSTMLGAMEMLKSGVTSVMDDAFHVPIATEASVDAICRAYADSGMRARVAIDQPNVVEYAKFPYLADLLPPQAKARMDAAPRQSTEELLELYRHLIATWDGAAGGRIGAALSCSALQRVERPYLHALGDLSRSRKLPFNIHILETQTQRALGDEVYGRSLVQVAADEGVLSPHSVVIHAIWVDDADIRTLAETGVTVAHNPVCNLRLGSGIAPFRAWRKAGVHVCLGTDEAIADDSINLWGALKGAGLLHTLADPDWTTWPTAAEVLAVMYDGGARAIGMPVPIGRIAPGAAGDLALIDLDTEAFTPLNDARRQMVYAETGSSVRHVVVAGRIVVRDGRLTTVDEKALRAEARDCAKAYRAETEAAERAAADLEPYYAAMVRRSFARPGKLIRRLDPS